MCKAGRDAASEAAAAFALCRARNVSAIGFQVIRDQKIAMLRRHVLARFVVAQVGDWPPVFVNARPFHLHTDGVAAFNG